MWTEIEKITWSDLTGLSSQKRHAGPPSTHMHTNMDPRFYTHPTSSHLPPVEPFMPIKN